MPSVIERAPPGHEAPSAQARSRLPLWQPWTALALFSFLLHFIWEMLSIPFYAGMVELTHGDGVRCCLQATLGDMVIALVAYAVVALPKQQAWLMRPDPVAILGFLGVGIGITVVFEHVSVYRLTRWSYAPAMPVIAGIGVLPLLQWIILPLLTLWLARRHLAAYSSFPPQLETAP